VAGASHPHNATVPPGTIIPMSESPSTVARLAPVAAGCGLAGAAVTVALVDPSAPGSPFPPCLFHVTTGLWCPGCGLTRGTHHLLTGDLAASLGSNVFTPLVLVGIGLAWLAWLCNAFGRPVRPLGQRLPPRTTAVALATVIAFGVLRNLPVGPFDALAP
jgi:hypothetical protein